MPLPPAQREMDRLVEDWPADPTHFDLAAFSARFWSDRPQLSAPALDRIGARLSEALDQRDRRLARSRRRKSALRWMLRPRRLAPVSAAAVVALAAGVWLWQHDNPSGADSPALRVSPTRMPVIHPLPAAGPATRPIINE